MRLPSSISGGVEGHPGNLFYISLLSRFENKNIESCRSSMRSTKVSLIGEVRDKRAFPTETLLLFKGQQLAVHAVLYDI